MGSWWAIPTYSFGGNVEMLLDRAWSAMNKRAPELASNFVKIVHFVHDNPDLAVAFRGKTPPAFGSELYLDKLAEKYARGFDSKPLPRPQTVPDPALAVVMEHGYLVDRGEIGTQIDGHRWAMVAENVVGDLLERYIYSELGEDDWIWCAGEVVKHCDFIRGGVGRGNRWESLQIKNRDNSENSSSSRVRIGTEIQKWHRTVSRTGETRWDEFPVGSADVQLSEHGFQEYIIEYIGNLPK